MTGDEGPNSEQKEVVERLYLPKDGPRGGKALRDLAYHPGWVAGDDEWLDIDGTARYLNLPNRSIRRRINAGEFEAVGRRREVRRQDFDDDIDRCRIKPVSW